MNFRNCNLCLILFFTMLYNTSVLSFDYGRVKKGQDYQSYLDSIGSPIVDNPNVGEVGAYYTMGAFHGETPAYIYATRYRDVAYMNKNGVHAFRDQSHKGREYSYKEGKDWRWQKSECGYWKNTLASEYSVKGIPNCLTDEHYISGDSRYELPVKALSGFIGTSENGYLVSVFVGEDMMVYIGRNNKFRSIDVGLNNKSDLKDILSIYPTSNSEFFLSVYLYKNSFNKSIYVYHLKGLKNDGFKSVSKKLIHNNGESDIGVNPEIYLADNYVHVSSKSKLGAKYWRIAPRDIDNMDVFFNPNQQPDNITLNLSYSLASLSTEMMTESILSGEELPDNYQQPNYDLSSSVLTEIGFSGRLLNQHLVLSYAQSKLDGDLSDTRSIVSKKLSGYLNIGGDLAGAEGLRLGFSFYDMAGRFSYFENGNIKSEIFKSKRETYSLAWTKNQGFYSGLRYSTYDTPSEITLLAHGKGGESKNSHSVINDKSLNVHIFNWMFGYDESQYNSRYMMSYSSFYYDYEAGIGLEYFDLSQAAKSEALQLYDQGSDTNNFSLNLSGTLNFGYAYQLRSSALKGLGGAIFAGVRVFTEHTLENRRTHSISENEYIPVYRRYLLNYGPFIKLSAIF